MRSFFLFIFIIPFIAGAQINRSAKELASEKIQEYIVKKLFKNKAYSSIAFGDIKPMEQENSEVAWSLAHKFRITDNNKYNFVNDGSTGKVYKFMFYLDEKMKILKAETYYTE